MDVFSERWSRKLQRLIAHLVPVIALLLIAMAYYLGIRTERTGFVAEVLDPNLKKITQPVLNAFRGRPPSVHKLMIGITDERMDSLRMIRENAIENGWLHADQNIAFTVQLSFGEYGVLATMNLLEGPSQQLAFRRWPFHLHLSDGDTLFWMSAMDLRPLDDISSLYAWLFQKALRDRGLLTYGHEMLELRLNDQDMGLYTLEGASDSATLAFWDRSPGPILRFDDALLAGAREALEVRAFPSLAPPQGDWLVAPIINARVDSVAIDAESSRRYAAAVQQLEDLRSGRRRPSQVFDIPSLARLFALADLFGGQDAISWWNLRFLEDSVPANCIVVPKRTPAGEPIEAISALHLENPLSFDPRSAGFQEKLFNDSIFYRHYIANLDTFSQRGWLEGFLERIGPGLEERATIIKAEYPQEILDTMIFDHNRTIIQQTLRPKDLVLAYVQDAAGDRQRLALANVHSLPIRVVSIVSGTDTVELPEPVVLLPRELDKPLSYTLVPARMPRDLGEAERILVHVLGLQELRSAAIRTWSTFEAN